MKQHTSAKALIVLGMHRSGTSALSRTLNLLGVDLGNSFYQGPVNPRGYWEHEPVMRINDEFLKHFLGFWTSSDPLPNDWLRHEKTIEARRQLVEILRADFGSKMLWGLKDPRLCVLLPLYLQIFDELGVQPHFIHCIRNPVDVALSLQKRDQTQVEFSLVLWLRYVTEAFYSSYPYSNAFLSFDSLLSDCEATMNLLAHQLGIKWPREFAEARSDIDEYLEPSLRAFSHGENDLEGSGEIFDWISESYSLLRSLTNREIHPQDAKRLFEIREELNSAFVADEAV